VGVDSLKSLEYAVQMVELVKADLETQAWLWTKKNKKENSRLEFKLKIDLNSPGAKAEFIRDVIALANSEGENPREDAHLVIGFREGQNYDIAGEQYEEGGVAYAKDGVQVVAPAQPGKYQDVKTPGEAKIDPFKAADSSKQKPGDVKADVEWHVHPSASITDTTGPQSAPGTVVFGGTTTTTTYQFNQPPSGVDIQGAGAANLSIVVGARDKTVYVYDSSGCTCKESLKDFNKTPNQ
jgi:hypothetical protein